jgi:hypothetical protein
LIIRQILWESGYLGVLGIKIKHGRWIVVAEYVVKSLRSS